jgi:hypothetical protein
MRSYLKNKAERARGMAQVVESLPRKREALSSNSLNRPPKKKNFKNTTNYFHKSHY